MGRRPSFPEIPVFENEMLRSVANAFARRRKALSHRCDKIELTCSTDIRETVAFERLDLTFWLSKSGSDRFHLTLWEDSQAWVWGGKRRKRGWIFEIKLDTNLWHVTPAEIVQRAEETRLLISLADRAAAAEDHARFREIWSPVSKTTGRQKRGRR